MPTRHGILGSTSFDHALSGPFDKLHLYGVLTIPHSLEAHILPLSPPHRFVCYSIECILLYADLVKCQHKNHKFISLSEIRNYIPLLQLAYPLYSHSIGILPTVFSYRLTFVYLMLNSIMHRAASNKPKKAYPMIKNMEDGL